MDFVTDIAQIEADEEPEQPPKNRMEAFWQWVVSFSTLSVSASTSHTFYPRCNVCREHVYKLCWHSDVLHIPVLHLIPKFEVLTVTAFT